MPWAHSTRGIIFIGVLLCGAYDSEKLPSLIELVLIEDHKVGTEALK